MDKPCAHRAPGKRREKLECIRFFSCKAVYRQDRKNAPHDLPRALREPLTAPSYPSGRRRGPLGGGGGASQRYLSPLKGFGCAHRVKRGGPSCAAYARESFLRHGLVVGGRLVRRQFRRCAEAARSVNPRRKRRAKPSAGAGLYGCEPSEFCGPVVSETFGEAILDTACTDVCCAAAEVLDVLT